ncbi:MAG: hypothetical protein WCH58_02940 [Candidatus Saccharibacteria bacterium]
MKYIFRFLLILLLFSAGVFGYSYFQKNILVDNKYVSSASLAEPVQDTSDDSYSISFKSGNYDYAVNPLFNYTITGVVVSKHDYNPADTDIERPIRYDLCIVWGKNVSEKTYVSPDISFSQSQRFCNYSFHNSPTFYTPQISNSHIVTTSSAVLDKLQSINPGDEVKITGQLVNLSVTGNDSNGQMVNNTWKSSTDRKDTGAGACEVIYVDSVDILSTVHEKDVVMNSYSYYVIIGLLIIFIIRAIIFVLFTGTKKNNGRIVG